MITSSIGLREVDLEEILQACAAELPSMLASVLVESVKTFRGLVSIVSFDGQQEPQMLEEHVVDLKVLSPTSRILPHPVGEQITCFVKRLNTNRRHFDLKVWTFCLENKVPSVERVGKQ